MDLPKPLPILRLPFLAIEEIFKAMHPTEIINFSMISKRTRFVTKNKTFYSKYDIRLHINKPLGIAIQGTNNLVVCLYLMASGEQMKEKIADMIGSDYIIRRVFKYSKDPIEDWKQLCKHVLEIFKREAIDVLSMQMDTFVDQNISIIDFLKTNVKSVNKCSVRQSEEENDVDEHAAYLLDNLKVNIEFNSYLHIKNANFYRKIPKDLKELYIRNSQWIRYERLLEIDCEHVSLENNQFTNTGWNMFIKKWIAMETHLNLKCLKFDFKSLEDLTVFVLHDIPHEVVEERVKRTLITDRDKTEEISGGVDIRRIDGKTATFFAEYDIFSMMIVH
ncbi:hypothetical protein CRE_16252 [Caenorhabditis remanei]|uniref:F-box domain-containing protein n=1 Tax=Caenorhabditis remanei TaxID=31234 RepID=E3N2J2_CAERE|nr:hypothetical protein CRE_16252 [Caenorhabditis remanei]